MIPVTKPFLPPREEYNHYLDKIWENQWLTNNGPLVQELEKKLQAELNFNNLLFVTNGTLALQLALKAIGASVEIITTPFSFVATSSSIVWEGSTPVFADIDPQTLNIDPKKIEAAITPKTSAILTTHVYGNPCDIEAIKSIADKYNLQVIYDGAHAFGVNYKDRSVFEYGDISTCSLHATKLYHSGEGGLVFSKNPRLLKKLNFMRNFGFNGPENFAELGINGKNSEFHAAMGLANLPHIKEIHEKRKVLCQLYDRELQHINAFVPKWNPQATRNYAYYPIVFETEELALSIFSALNENDIHARRYFYPSLSSVLPYIKSTTMPITDDIAKRVLCLPLYYDLTEQEVIRICQIIISIENI